MKGPFYRNLALLLTVILTFVLLFNLARLSTFQVQKISFSDLKKQVESGKIKELTIKGRIFRGKLADGNRFESIGYESDELYKLLDQYGVEYRVEPSEASPWLSILGTWLPMILFIALFFAFMRQLQGGTGKAMSFGKSRARLVSPDSKNKVTFADVAGIDETLNELKEIVEFLKDPKKFVRLGGRIPKGVLLMGAPGTGKTLVAKAIAGEAGVPFFNISGSDFVEMFVGVGASRVRDLFEQAKKHSPCIIFIDEIDAVGRHRGAGLGGGHDEREQTLNQLLVEMDGFEANEGVIIMAATNRPDILDPALLRPGRFDRRIVVPVPDVKGREGILKVHVRNKPLAPNVELSTLARGTPGFTGADLENLVNEAALIAARKSKNYIETEDLEEAKDKVLMGVERKSMIISDRERKSIAYHEAGHALVASLLPDTDPIHKVSIIPRGMALGATQQLPLDDRHTYSKAYLENLIATMLGGRAAEEIVLGELTTGAGNDLERTSEVARKMVCEWGMSETLGPVTLGKKEELVFLGKEISQHRDFSEKTAEGIDDEVKEIITKNYERAKKLVTDNINGLHGIADALLTYETLTGDEIRKLVKGEALDRKPTKGKEEGHKDADSSQEGAAG